MREKYIFKDCLKNNWWLYLVATLKFFSGSYIATMQAEGMSNFEIFLAGFIGFMGITLIVFIYWYIRYGFKQQWIK
ncbi:MAG: hypothetical protein HZA36_00125 [Parcubacteria group bacterium]|nr:hypothetical protein [Parcubacteria group bacterium]